MKTRTLKVLRKARRRTRRQIGRHQKPLSGINREESPYISHRAGCAEIPLRQGEPQARNPHGTRMGAASESVTNFGIFRAAIDLLKTGTMTGCLRLLA